jgi:hypothetical protein
MAPRVRTRGYTHERVGLLLLLENGSRGLVNLWRVSKGEPSEAVGDAYVLVLLPRTISVILLATVRNVKLVAINALQFLGLGVSWFSRHVGNVYVCVAARVAFLVSRKTVKAAARLM